LGASEIAFFDRLIAVADILSALYGKRSYKGAYPKEKIVGILNDMVAQNLIDPGIVRLSIEHYDEIATAVVRESLPVTEAYHAMNEEYARTRNEIKGKTKTRLF
jgi:response regulator RpfG family c-di-GMP phosphodiesterase